MEPVTLKSWFMLSSPVRVRLTDGSTWNTYSTLLPLRPGDTGLPATVAVRSGDLPLASGTRVSVIGSMYFVDGAILITATSLVVTNIPLPSLYSYVFFPHVSFLGTVVSNGVYDGYCTGVKTFDVRVDCTGRWPYTHFTIKCLFNRDAPRHRDTDLIRTGAAVFIYGVYSGRDANKNLMVSVHDCDFSAIGALPARDIVDPVNPFAGRILRRGLVQFTEPARASTAPLPGDDPSITVLPPALAPDPVVAAEIAAAAAPPTVIFSTQRRVANPVPSRAIDPSLIDDTSSSSATSADSDVDVEVRSLAHNVLANKAVARRGRSPAPRAIGPRASPYGRSPLSDSAKKNRSVSTTATLCTSTIGTVSVALSPCVYHPFFST
ncbi:hypothetical protein AURDEDRAFT_135538 [Auricularia subglabra TFB-10046 SS5]|nr:hypothetical protein AURDEDRAFT_135538 [Auricularia subglabra TFB-10046 SS5]